MSDGPVRPRVAASLIVLRHGAGEPEVLMGRRRAKASFIPDAYVFPGGGVDRSDARARPATPLAPEVERHLMAACASGRARALAMAAVRETFEETGLMLGRAGDVGPVNGAGWSHIRATGLAPDLARLDYVGRAITPPMSPIRFHARFFMADAAGLSGELGGSGELLDLHWVALSRAYDLPIVDVTEFMLGEARRLAAAAPEGGRRPKPLFCYRQGGTVVRYR